MKRFSLLLLSAFLLCSFPAVHAKTTQLYATDGVHVRKEASVDSAICTTIELGTPVKKTGKSGNWIAVRVGEIEGYIYKDYLSSTQPSAVDPSEDSSDDSYTEHKKGSASVCDPAELREKAIDSALSHLGDTYSQTRRDEDGYADCSSLVRDAYLSASGQFIGNTTVTQSDAMENYFYDIEDIYDVTPGDLVYHLSGDNHTGIYLGNGRVLHASQKAGKVKISTYDSSSTYWEYGCNAAKYCVDQQ